MIRFAIPLLLASLPAWGQFAPAARPAASVSLEQPRLSFKIVRDLEKNFDARIEQQANTAKEPLNQIGFTRGLYLPGYGMVLTAEVDLIITPKAGGLFHREITSEERTQIHARKLQQLPLLQQMMRETMASTARALDIMPANERIVLAVRLWYQQQWEDTTGLPTQILMTGDRRSVAAGQFKEESSK